MHALSHPDGLVPPKPCFSACQYYPTSPAGAQHVTAALYTSFALESQRMRGCSPAEVDSCVLYKEALHDTEHAPSRNARLGNVLPASEFCTRPDYDDSHLFRRLP